jgi:DNA-binding CsgD family transcriptional regulator
MRAVGPRIESALNLGRFTQRSAFLMAIKNLIDLIAGAALNVDAALHVLAANEQGFVWLAAMGLNSRSLASLPDVGALSQSVAATLRGPSGSAGEDVLLRSGNRTYRVSCILLAEQGSAAAGAAPTPGQEPSCLLVIREQDFDFGLALARRYALTRAEARLVSHLAQGASLAQTADAMGISRETARTHLKAVFSKTDTKRQAELVLLFAKGMV